jgi:hypothetical protein
MNIWRPNTLSSNNFFQACEERNGCLQHISSEEWALVPHGYFQLAFVTEISSSAVPEARGFLDIISKFTRAFTRFIWKDFDFSGTCIVCEAVFLS